MLQLKNIVKDYHTGDEVVQALKGVSVNFRRNEFVSILGQSGCGKTTLLKILGFMDQQTDGDVIFDGVNTNELWKEELTDIRRRKIGFVFQDFNLMDSLSVKENIMLPVLLDKKEQKECEEKAEALEKQFGIEHLQEKNPYELSGGERQRVAICRALINDPSIIFADEPTGNLDSKTSREILDILKFANQKYKQTILLVTHDEKIALQANRIITIGDGKIIKDEVMK